MYKAAILYRKSTPARNSIEKVFYPLESWHWLNRVELPHDLHSVWDLFRLFYFGLKIKEKNVHITGDVYYMATLMFWKRVVITVHDCNHYEDLTGFKKWLMGIIWFELPIKASKKVFVISPFVEQQLKRYFDIPDNKIIVIPNSFDPVPILNNFKIENEYFTILTIGTYPHKNQERLVEAVKDIERVKLVFVGNLRKEIKRLLNKNKINYEDYFNISKEELNLFYNSSDLLFFASIKEGFGLPILEAQSCKLPVLTSNTTSMPYVAGDGACIVDPFSVVSIKQGIMKIKENHEYRNKLIKNGLKNITRFGEDKFVSSYIKEYQKVFNF